ncbi:HEPN domain-containing protein [Ornithinimicrobium cerasi]|uniref:HEPN domain-containing protein n=1 Tax=Ornithinimicrobium cerasi TaxID=2248773 RepID=A0A285VI34_9MICO|nr:HEPN domain-containing protein [Ornithinimicrobium cerasi]
MVRWGRGEASVQALIQAGDLQSLVGGAANGEPLMARASTTLQSARSVLETDPDSAFVLAYDAARQALTALLTHQGLRPTTRGGHYAVEQAVKAQFGHVFRPFGALRRRRNELEYPTRAGDEATVDEARDAVQRAAGIVQDAGRLLPGLGVF